MTKYDRLREAALRAEAEERDPAFVWPARENLHNHCTPQTILALLDCVEALRDRNFIGFTVTAENKAEVDVALAALDKERGE